MFFPFYLHRCFFWGGGGTQCNSESSRSEDVSSDGDEEDDSSSLSPSSSLSCSKAGQNAPPDSPAAPCNQIEGSNFLSATPAQWSVEEVCRFISSLQGKLAGRPAPPLSPLYEVLPSRLCGQVAKSWRLSSCRRRSTDRLCCCCERTTSSPP